MGIKDIKSTFKMSTSLVSKKVKLHCCKEYKNDKIINALIMVTIKYVYSVNYEFLYIKGL